MSAVARLAGVELGTRTVTYTETDAILYALCVGARSTDLSLVYEKNLKVLPTYALGLGLWAVEKAGELDAYDRLTSLHAAQTLTVHEELPPSGTLEMTARVDAVWDKGKSAMIDIAVECEQVSATYSIFLPGYGGWGGDRGPAAATAETGDAEWEAEFAVSEDLAALYRLTGDLHPVHIDPEVAAGYGFDRPILHGLCTLGIASRMVAGSASAMPWELKELQARFAAPVTPGTTLKLSARGRHDTVHFGAAVGETAVLKSGYARF